jgi:hypothetical protein
VPKLEETLPCFKGKSQVFFRGGWGRGTFISGGRPEWAANRPPTRRGEAGEENKKPIQCEYCCQRLTLRNPEEFTPYSLRLIPNNIAIS